MMETKLMVNIGLKTVFGSFVSLSVAAMLHCSPPGNNYLYGGSVDRNLDKLLFRAPHELRILTRESLWTFCCPGDLSSQHSLGHNIQCHSPSHYSHTTDL